MSGFTGIGDRPVKMSVTVRRVFGSLALVGMIAASGHAADTKPTRSGPTTGAAGAPLLRVTGVVGTAELIREDGSRVRLAIGASPPIGSVVETDESAHVAIVIAPTTRTAAEQADVLLLGPQTRVRFAAAGLGGDEAPGKPVIEAVVERGTYRALVRQAEADSAYVLRIGARRVLLRGADLIGTFNPGEDDAGFLLHKGRLTIEAGERKIRLKDGMMRTIEGGRVLGARALAQSRWGEAIAQTAVPGVDMTQVKAAVVKPGEESAIAATPGKEKPGTEGSTGREKPAIRQPDGQETARQAPTRDGPDRLSATNQRPGATRREIVEEYIYVRLQTTKGDIILELDRGRAPITVDNFLTYIETGFYQGTVFHRVASNFAIQAGAYTTEWEKKKTGPPIKGEWPNGLSNRRGAIAMARPNKPDSATSEFFINVKNNPFLDNPPGQSGYTVFGKVIAGMNVVDAIKDTPVKQSRLNERERAEPIEPIVIEEVEVIPPDAAEAAREAVETASDAGGE